MTTFSTLLYYDYFSMPSHYVSLFHDAPLCLLFPRCCAVSTFSVLLLRYGYFFHAAVLCSLSSQLLHSFHALIQEFSWGGGGERVWSRSIRRKKAFEGIQLFPGEGGGGASNFFQGGVQLLIPYRTPYNL